MVIKRVEASPQSAAEVFVAEYGYPPVGVWSAPGRVNVIGEHVDYAEGICLPFALSQRTYCAAAPRTDGILRIASVLPGGSRPSKWEGKLIKVGPGWPRSWPAYPAGVVWCLWQDAARMHLSLNENSGVDLMFVSNVPSGAGLSSSAAIELAAACAIVDLFGPGLDSLSEGRLDEVSQAIIESCIRAENDVVGASTGGLDQSVSFRGQQGMALELDMGRHTVEEVPFDVAAQNMAILVMNTNAPHSLGDGQYALRRAIVDRVREGLKVGDQHRAPNLVEQAVEWASHQPEAAGSPEDRATWLDVVRRRMRHIVSESQRTEALAQLLKEGALSRSSQEAPGQVAAVGELMVASHESLRDDYEVSCPELDSAVEAALAHGAWGARMTGGGFGGSAIALVNLDDVEAVKRAVLEDAQAKGMAKPTFLCAVPSSGACRDL